MVRPYVKHHLMVRPYIKHHLMVRRGRLNDLRLDCVVVDEALVLRELPEALQQLPEEVTSRKGREDREIASCSIARQLCPI